jgi:CRP-like cAMP-binding protein
MTHLDSKELMQQLKKALEIFGITEQELTRIAKRIQVREFKRGDFFCKKGKPCKQIGILFEGLLMAHFDNDDKDVNVSRFFFTPQNLLVTSFESFRDQKISNENIVALESSSLACISYKDLNKLFEEIPSVNKLGRLFAEESYIKALQRIHDLQTLDAEQRVNKFHKSNKDLFNRVSKQHLASYLGMNRNIFARFILKLNKK